MEDHEDAGHLVGFDKEEGDEDHEEHGEGRNEMDAISMVKNQLQTIEREAKKLQDAIHDSEEIPEWMKAKITKAQDYIESVSEVMQSRHEDGQAVHDDEEGMDDEGMDEGEGMSTDGREGNNYDWKKHNANSGGRGEEFEQEEFGMSFSRKPSDRRSVSGSGRGDDKINPKMKTAARNAMTKRKSNGRYDGMKKRDWKNPF